MKIKKMIGKKRFLISLLTLCFALTGIGGVVSSTVNASSTSNTWTDTVEKPLDYAYSFSVIGDTQVVSYGASEKMANIYDYIVASADENKTKHVFGLGDITDASSYREWDVAAQEIAKMDGVVSYSLARGNHDTVARFNKSFGENSTYSSQYIARYPVGYANTVHEFSAGILDYLVVVLDYGAADDVLEWADEIITSYPNHNVIISTHSYTSKIGELDTYKTCAFNSGEDIWNKLVRKHENIVLVLSGHTISENHDIVFSEDIGDNGNKVCKMMINPQGLDNATQGKCGMVAEFYFSADGKNVEVQYYSTIREQYYRVDQNHFNFTLNTVQKATNKFTNNENLSCIHTQTEWRVREEATCVSDGLRDNVCLDCGKIIETENIYPIAHEYEDDCACHDRHCIHCNRIAIATKTHKLSEIKERVEPTCLSDGYIRRTCTVCGDDVFERIESKNLFTCGEDEWFNGGHMSAYIDIDRFSATLTIGNAGTNTYSAIVREIYLKPTDYIRISVGSGKCDVKMLSRTLSEVKLAGGVSNETRWLPLANIIPTEGYYELFIYALGAQNDTCEINELAVLSGLDDDYHNYGADNKCKHCGAENLAKTELQTNYGKLFDAKYADKWTGNEYFETDTTGMTYSMDGSVTAMETSMYLGLRTSDKLSFAVETGNFRIMLKRENAPVIYVGTFWANSSYTINLSDCIAEDDNYELCIIALTDSGVESQHRLNGLTLSA
jgi:hypothetical protein